MKYEPSESAIEKELEVAVDALRRGAATMRQQMLCFALMSQGSEKICRLKRSLEAVEVVNKN